MDFTTWGIPNSVGGWGITPMSLMAPFALLILMMMARRFSQPAGPKMETRDVKGAALITVIIGAAFLWIFAGLGLLGRIVH
jgi:hypothetical protein